MPAYIPQRRNRKKVKAPPVFLFARRVGILYRYTVDHAAGSWNASEVARVASLSKDVAGVKDELAVMNDAGVSLISGGYIMPSGAIHSVDSYDYTDWIDVFPGENVLVTTALFGNASIVIADEDKNVIDVISSVADRQLADYDIAIPETGKYIRASCLHSVSYGFSLVFRLAKEVKEIANEVRAVASKAKEISGEVEQMAGEVIKKITELAPAYDTLMHDTVGGVPIDEIEFEKGYIDGNGEYSSSHTRFCIRSLEWSDDYWFIFPSEKISGYFVLYDASDNVIYSGAWADFVSLQNRFPYFPFAFFSSFNPVRCSINLTTSGLLTVTDELLRRFNSYGMVRANNGMGLINLTEYGPNLSPVKSSEFTRYTTIRLIPPLPAGTYVLKADIESSDKDREESNAVLYSGLTASGTGVAIRMARGKDKSQIFTLPWPAQLLYLYASINSTLSVDDTAVWNNISIEPVNGQTGSDALMTVIDQRARKQVISVSNFLSFENITITGESSTEYKIERPDKNIASMILYADAKFTRAKDVTDYPRVRLGVTTDRNFYRPSTWYRIGKENEFDQHEWRSPAYFWDSRPVTLEIYVPDGCELSIRKLGNRYENQINRMPDNGLRFFARPATCNITADLSMPALQMAYRQGYNTSIVIPKVSSDGVWFAYHDDTWDIASTHLRNADGSTITDSAYNGKRFHEIPYAYLEQFDWGRLYGVPAFEGLKGMKLDDYFEFLSKTGMSPRFSMHPSVGINTTENLTALKKLVNTYGLLSKLTILVNNIDQVFPVFGNDIAGYCFGNATGSSWDGDKRVDSGFEAALAAKEKHGITTEISCGLWSDSLFSDRDKAKEFVGQIRVAGFSAGVFEYTHIGIDGTSHSQLWSEDLRWLASIGVTEFTINYHTSVGLNW